MSGQPIIGVVGLGVMGLGISQVFAQAGFSVRATDQQPTLLGSAAARFNELLVVRVKSGKLADNSRSAMTEKFSVVSDITGLGTAALVIEAIVEDIHAKQNLFAALEKVVDPSTILASNTSSLSITELAHHLSHRQRFLGMHFFNPAPVMKLVELVPHAETDAEAVALARHLAETSGKTVITCADRPGFIVNRCTRPFYGEALALLEEGRTASEIDSAMLQAGYRMGPLSLIDLVGSDINLAATKGLAAAMHNHPRYYVFKALQEQVAHGNLGRKSGRGFLFPDLPGPPPADAQKIALRIQAVLVNEAASLLGEGSVDELDIDTALKLGLNFPSGPFEAARAIGFDQIRSELSALEVVAPSHLKGRYVLLPALESLA